MITDVVIPALNEEESIGHVLADIPRDMVRHIVVVDNGSTDRTAEAAAAGGAVVLREDEKGYGAACLKGIAWCAARETPPDVLCFLDADYSDHPEEMPKVLEPIANNSADLVIGSRATGNRERGSMTIPQVFGNWLATRLLELIYGVQFTDLGPFRAIRWKALQQIGMEDRNFGWTVEMQLKAAKHNLRCTEVPVSYRRRIGVSKVSGTVKGTVMAGYKILFTLFKYR
jgi:glycosyltransferase involved in cell wall biosynthesis